MDSEDFRMKMTDIAIELSVIYEVYGRSSAKSLQKLFEKKAMMLAKQALVIRTSWLKKR